MTPLRRTGERQPEGLRLRADDAMLVVEAMEVVGEANRVDRDRVRCPPLRGLCDDERKLEQPLDQVPFLGCELRGSLAGACAFGVSQNAGDPRVRVLDVVDGVLLRPLRGEIDVDVDRLVVTARDEVPARRVDPDLVDELVQEHDVTAALGDLLRLAAFDDVDQLVDQHFDALGVVAEHRRCCLQPSDVPVVIGAEHVDGTVEAALELVADVGDIGREVEIRAVGRAHERAVLVVAVRARARPERPVRFERVELRQHLCDMLLDVALMAPGVDGNAELRDLAADLFEHVLDRVAVDLGELVDVVTLVPALGKLLPASPRLDGGAKEIDLPTGVVEVVLAFDLVSGVVEDPRDGVAVRAVSGGPDGQRACRIGGDELDLDLLRRLGGAGSVIGPDFAPARRPTTPSSPRG